MKKTASLDQVPWTLWGAGGEQSVPFGRPYGTAADPPISDGWPGGSLGEPDQRGLLAPPDIPSQGANTDGASALLAALLRIGAPPVHAPKSQSGNRLAALLKLPATPIRNLGLVAKAAAPRAPHGATLFAYPLGSAAASRPGVSPSVSKNPSMSVGKVLTRAGVPQPNPLVKLLSAHAKATDSFCKPHAQPKAPAIAPWPEKGRTW